MNTISRMISWLPLALTALLGCTSTLDSSATDDEQVVAAAVASNSVLAERARLAASGRFLLPARAARAAAAPSLQTDYGDALDLPADNVLEATLTGPAEAAAILNGLGIIKPLKGSSFVVLSTGIAVGGPPPEPGTDFPGVDEDGDAVQLALRLQVPAGATRMSLQYNFLSSESPDFILQGFNDEFTVELVETTGTRAFSLASVNSSNFFDVSNSRAKDTGYDLYALNPSGVDDFDPKEDACPPGQACTADAGLTGFQGFSVDVTGGSELTVILRIADSGDGLLDSAVLIDAIQFSALEALDPNTLDATTTLINADGKITTNPEDLVSGAKGLRARGALADGATEVLIRMLVPESGTTVFSLPGAAAAGRNGSLTSITGVALATDEAVPTISVGGADYALAIYRAPPDFDANGDLTQLERTIAITASFTGALGTSFPTQLEFQLRRPPVVLAHGLWSTPVEWLKMPFVTNPALEITYVDHASYGCQSELRVMPPADNLLGCPLTRAQPGQGVPLCLTDVGDPVGDAMAEALEHVRRLGIAATQVDVVAHGAAGLRVRQYINRTNFKNPANLKQGDVNRLITINTPHFGAAMADAIVKARNAHVDTTSRDSFLCGARIDAGAPVEDGEIDALTTTASTLGPSDVKGHALYGTGGKAVTAAQSRDKLYLVSRLYKTVEDEQFPLPARIFKQPSSAVWGPNQHDMFSDIASQQGGLPTDATTPLTIVPTNLPSKVGESYTEVDAFRSLQSPVVAREIATLLNSPVDSTKFASFAASPPRPLGLAARAAVADELPVPSALPPGAALRIVSPARGTEVIAGSKIIVEVVADNFVPTSVSVMTSKTVASSETAPFRISLDVPSELLGPIRVLAVGEADDDEAVYSQDLVLIVKTAATIQTLSILNQDPVLFGRGTQRQLSVVGRYDDGATREITSSFTGTLYRSSNPNVVAVSSEGVLTAVGSGIATVVVQNGAALDSVSVTVKANRPPSAIATGGVTLTCVPPGAQVPVELDGTGSFDPDGDALAFSWRENGVELATGPHATIALGTGTHAIDLVVADAAGSSAGTTVTVTIQADAEPPAVTLVGATPQSVECGSPFTDGGATALDGCDGDVTAGILASSNVNTAVTGSYAVHYEVNDKAGLTGTASRSVAVQDTTPPRLTVVGANPRTTECGLPFVDQGATATDVCSGDLTALVSTQSSVDPRTPGSYQVAYAVHDGAGLTAAASRAVAVQDTAAPQLTVVGANPRTAECGSPFVDQGATATDVCDGDLSAAVSVQSTVNPAQPGTYTVGYQVHDRAGLTAAASRSVSIADTAAPRLTLRGDNPRTLECGAPFVDDGATAADVCDGDLTRAIAVRSQVNPRVLGRQTVDYTVRDRAGLTATATRVVTVADRTPPSVDVDPMRQLWPSNLQYRRFDLSDCAEVVDACSGPVDIDRRGEIIAIHSDERDRSNWLDPDDDIVITGSSSFKLRQQRDVFGNGRVYEIEFAVRDDAGNRSSVNSCFIGVKTAPFSRTPVNDGRRFTVRP